ncbi:MAG: ATP-binding protein [Thermodesulfobacteriota bacterium]|nr:ATP-binding protein [Thermodesulfobacteriota bacterium]
MDKHIGCINSLAIIEYVEEREPGKSAQLFEDLGPEMAGISNPKAFLSDLNNWISSSLMILIWERARMILGDEDAAYKIGFNSVLKQHLGYIQKIIIYAFGNPSKGIKQLQRINDHFNKTKKVQLLSSSRNGSVVRLVWAKGIPLSRDFCSFNKGVYEAIPTIWGIPPARLEETKCFFSGDEYCEYHLQWETQNRIRDIYHRIFTPWKIFQDSRKELERDKEILRDKYNQVYQLNQDLQRKVDQLTTLQESGTAILSTLKMEELLDMILKRLLEVAHLDRAGIFLFDEDKDSLILIHAVGVEPDALSDLKEYQIPLAKRNNIIARTARGKRSVLIKDVKKMFLNPQNPLLLRLKPKAFVLVPMTVRGRLIGIMLGDNQNDRDFVTEIDKNFLTSFANQIAMALENANLYRKLEDSERKYREIVENVNEGIWILDGNGTIRFSNCHLGDMLGYENLVDHSVYSLVNEEGKKIFLRVLMENMRGRTAKEEIVLQRKSGDPVSVLISSVPIMTDDQYGGCLAMLTDLTDKKRIESRLLQAQKLESIGTMAGGIAHDFNNILTGILGYINLLKLKTGEESDIRRYADIIERSSLRAADLVTKLLAFSRDSRPGPSLASAVNEIVQETLELMKSSLPENIETGFSLQENLPLIKCDPTQVQQAILNICLNALDAMPDGGRLLVATIEVGYKKIRARCPDFIVHPGHYVCVSISDTGIGIDPEVRDRIFDPFFTTKEVGKGSGLGLAMAYGIVKSSEGCIHVKSENGQGTTFELFFPVTESAPELAEKPKKNQALAGSETILVVDDEEIVRDLTLEILSAYGYNVLLAQDGLEAIHVYKAFGHTIDLVLMDMIMPRMGGKEAYEKLKEINSDIKVLFCSGYGSDHQVCEELRESGLSYSSKPFTADELVRKVRQVLNHEDASF